MESPICSKGYRNHDNLAAAHMSMLLFNRRYPWHGISLTHSIIVIRANRIR
jgi:hypothetical protein